jgi:hypothetical protein
MIGQLFVVPYYFQFCQIHRTKNLRSQELPTQTPSVFLANLRAVSRAIFINPLTHINI